MALFMLARLPYRKHPCPPMSFTWTLATGPPRCGKVSLRESRGQGRSMAQTRLATESNSLCNSLLPETFVPSERDGEVGLYFDEKSSFARQVVKQCPGLGSWDSWYCAPWWLQQGDLMTLFASLGRVKEPVDYVRHMVQTLDGGVVALDVACGSKVDDTPAACNGKAFVILVSGLGGQSQGGYIRNMASTLLQRGYDVAVLNMRASSGCPQTTPRLYSAYHGATDDVRVGVRYVRESLLGGRSSAEAAPVFLIGWSNGGTIVANTLAEQSTGMGNGHAGPWTQATGGAILATPHDMMNSTRIVEGRIIGRMLYNPYVARNLVAQVAPKADWYRQPVARWSDDKPVVSVDIDMLLRATSIRELDEALTRRVFGYASVEDYYQDASSYQRLEHVSVPLLMVSAADDPICSGWVPISEVRRHPKIVLAYTAHGGHLGWQDSKNPRRSRWIETAVADFLDSIA